MRNSVSGQFLDELLFGFHFFRIRCFGDSIQANLFGFRRLGVELEDVKALY